VRVADTPGDGQEGRVTDHPVVGAHASFRHVPASPQCLERLDVLEPIARQGQHELLHLHGRREVRAEDAPWIQDLPEGRQWRPRLGKIQNTPIEPVGGARNLRNNASTFALP